MAAPSQLPALEFEVGTLNRGQFQRNANAEELARLEGPRRALRSTARWARFVGIYLPCLVALVTIGLTLTSYPGNQFEKTLASLGTLGAVFAVLCLPLLLSSTGRTISAQRRLEQDASNGFPIIEEYGEVSWGSRERGFIATTSRGRLISPLFTKFAAVPAYWNHFDRLAPGHYLFSLLPASRLVIETRTAAPHALWSPGEDHPVSAPAEDPVERALRTAFRNSRADATLNRGGRATAAQRWRLLVTHWWVFIAALLFGVASCLSLSEAWERLAPGSLVAAMVSLGLTAFLANLLVRVLLDAVQGKLESATGPVFLRPGKTDACGTIGSRTFNVSNARVDVFQSGRSYRVHWFKYTRVAVGAEPI